MMRLLNCWKLLTKKEYILITKSSKNEVKMSWNIKSQDKLCSILDSVSNFAKRF